jgi:hypothetical protein
MGTQYALAVAAQKAGKDPVSICGRMTINNRQTTHWVIPVNKGDLQAINIGLGAINLMHTYLKYP